MATRVFWIESFSNGARLGIMARPRGGEWLEDEVLDLKKQRVTVLVSLLELSEINELGLDKESQLCGRQLIDFIHFPIPDRNIPGSETKTAALIKGITERIDTGASVVIHCRMGIGRSSIIAGAILISKGYPTDRIIRQITDRRGLNVPDTQEQIDWLRKRERSF